jgi:hypothetical protein
VIKRSRKHLRKTMNRKTNSVIGHSTFFEVVGANLFASAATTDLRPPICRPL